MAHPLYHKFRIYMFMQLLMKAKKIPNACVVECGVGEGVMMQMAHEFIENFTYPTYLLDTFEGPDISQLTSSEMRNMSPEARSELFLRSYPRSTYDEIQNCFLKYQNVKLIKGSIPSLFKDNSVLFNDLHISLLHMDMNNAFPEAEALKFLYDKVTVPGFIIFDDYCFKDLRIQKDAIDKVCQELGIDIPASLPTGQGLIIKTENRSSLT